jgi:hypothetical protein
MIKIKRLDEDYLERSGGNRPGSVGLDWCEARNIGKLE